MADTDGHARRPSSSLERFRQKRASSSSSSIIPSKKNSENEPTVANGGFIAATPTTLAPRAQPRATPGSSATRPSTGDKLAALKARRSAARPASGRRGPAEESKAKSSSEDVPSKALFASGRWDELGGDKRILLTTTRSGRKTRDHRARRHGARARCACPTNGASSTRAAASGDQGQHPLRRMCLHRQPRLLGSTTTTSRRLGHTTNRGRRPHVMPPSTSNHPKPHRPQASPSHHAAASRTRRGINQ